MRSRVLRLPLWVWLVLMGFVLAGFFGVFFVGWWRLRLTAPPRLEASASSTSSLDGSGFKSDTDGLSVPFTVPDGYRVMPYDQVLSCGKVVRYFVVVPTNQLMEPCGGESVR